MKSRIEAPEQYSTFYVFRRCLILLELLAIRAPYNRLHETRGDTLPPCQDTRRAKKNVWERNLAEEGVKTKSPSNKWMLTTQQDFTEVEICEWRQLTLNKATGEVCIIDKIAGKALKKGVEGGVDSLSRFAFSQLLFSFFFKHADWSSHKVVQKHCNSHLQKEQE